MIDIPDSFLPKDSFGRVTCPKCQNIVSLCTCPVSKVLPSREPRLRPVIHLEKSGRKGKMVTVVSGLPRDEKYLAVLSREIKAKSGSGGTFYLGGKGGVVEVQGDKRDFLKVFFSSR